MFFVILHSFLSKCKLDINLKREVRECIFIEHITTFNCYNLYDLIDKQIIVARNVVFGEKVNVVMDI